MTDERKWTAEELVQHRDHAAGFAWWRDAAVSRLNSQAAELKAKDERIAELERDRDAQKKCADAYFSALADIRGSLGLSEHDEHEFVTDSIKRLVSRLGSSADYVCEIMQCALGAGKIVDRELYEMLETLLARLDITDKHGPHRDVEASGPCDHNWVDPSNEVVQAGTHRLCTKCGLFKDTAVVEASGTAKAAFDTMMGNPMETFPVVEEPGRHSYVMSESEDRAMHNALLKSARVVEGRFTCLDCDAPIPEHGYCAPCIEKMRELIDDPVVENQLPENTP